MNCSKQSLNSPASAVSCTGSTVLAFLDVDAFNLGAIGNDWRNARGSNRFLLCVPPPLTDHLARVVTSRDTMNHTQSLNNIPLSLCSPSDTRLRRPSSIKVNCIYLCLFFFAFRHLSMEETVINQSQLYPLLFVFRRQTHFNGDTHTPEQTLSNFSISSHNFIDHPNDMMICCIILSLLVSISKHCSIFLFLLHINSYIVFLSFSCPILLSAPF